MSLYGCEWSLISEIYIIYINSVYGDYYGSWPDASQVPKMYSVHILTRYPSKAKDKDRLTKQHFLLRFECWPSSRRSILLPHTPHPLSLSIENKKQMYLQAHLYWCYRKNIALSLGAKARYTNTPSDTLWFLFVYESSGNASGNALEDLPIPLIGHKLKQFKLI